MSLADDKKNIFTTIGAYTSVMQTTNLPDTTNIFPSINNKQDTTAFLLDTLKVVVGTDALQELTGKLFTDFIDKVEPQVKTALKNQFAQFNSGNNIPTQFTLSGSGYSVSVKKIDVFSKLKIKPESDIGNLLYNTTNVNFDKIAHDAIVNAGTNINFNNILFINYNTSTDSFIFKTANSNLNIGDWVNKYIDSLTIIDKKEFLTNIMNAIYGSTTSNTGKSPEEVNKELQVNKAIEQLVDNNDDSFIISPNDYDALLQKAQELVNGVTYYDLGCGVMEAAFPLSGLTNLVSKISGSTDSFAVGNAIGNTISASTTNTSGTTAANKQTIKDNFFQKIIKMIEQVLANAISTSPQIKTIMAITSAFQNHNIPILEEALADLKKFKVMIKCMISEMMQMLYQFIFNLVISYLVELLLPIIQKIIQEKINQYVGIIQSLTP